MNIKTNSIRIKTFIYLLSYSAIILLLLWLFQIVFLKIFYERYQYNKIVSYAATINEDNLKNLEQDVYKQDLCAEVHYYNEVYHYNSLNKDCILLSNNAKIENAKNKLLNNGDKKTIIKVIDPRYDSKSILYGVKLNDHTRIILNTKLEDVNSTTHILSGQLIYITLIVIILSGIMSILVSNMLNKPILKITKKAKEMAKGNYEPDEEIYNIQELDELTTTLNYAKSEIKNTDELRKDLMANVSHDLKTPLTGIKNYVELLNDPTISEEDKKSYLERLNQYTDRLSILITDLFEVSKANSGNIDLEYSNINIIEFIEQVCAENEELLQAKNLQLVTNLPEKEIHVCLDGNKTYRIFENLFTNISKYALENTRVFLDVKDIGNSVVITMKNTSKAPLDFDNDITERFVRGDKSRHEAGSGLGLAIVKSFTEVQNGTFMIETDGDLFKSILSFRKS